MLWDDSSFRWPGPISGPPNTTRRQPAPARTRPQTPSFPVVIGAGSHPFPFRTRKLSLLPPMVLRAKVRGRVGRCRDCFTKGSKAVKASGPFRLYAGKSTRPGLRITPWRLCRHCRILNDAQGAEARRRFTGMRPHFARTTAFVALITALIAVSGAAPPRQGTAPPGRDRDRVLRLTRGGPQRLDAVEGVTHTHDEQDLAAPPGDTLLVDGSPAAPPQPDFDSPAAIPRAAVPAPSEQFSRTTHALPRDPVPPPAWLHACAPDRAPPLA